MKAVGFRQSLPVSHPEALIDLELPLPVPEAHDVLVKISAIAVNPVDTKIRRLAAPAVGEVRIPGWDAVGEIVTTGSAVSGFQPGQRVYYAGALARQGSNAQYQAVDARLIAVAPQSLSDEQAAAMPLTTITAWEILFDRLQVQRKDAEPRKPRQRTLLITGGAGGVGSMMIQLAKQLTDLTVIATASRESSAAWCRELGADHVINHHQPLPPQLQAFGLNSVDMIASLTHTTDYMAQYVECLTPQGQLAVIDDADVLDVMPLKRKSISLHWESMFTRSMFSTEDIAAQGALLAEVAALVDSGCLRTTLSEVMQPFNAATLREAHRLIETQQTIGKIVISGFAAE